MTRSGVSFAAAIAGAVALSAAPCAAKTTTTNQFKAAVTVVSGCTVSAAPLIFIVPKPTNVNVDSTTTLTVKCTPLTTFTVDVDTGLWSNGINRRVKSVAGDFLQYDVYKDPPRSQVWGTGPAKNYTASSGLTGLIVLPVYGRLNATSNMKAGAYSDQLTVTITY